MQIVRQSQFTASPWKNGGGITHEAMRVPERGAFRWRVSIAHIDASGPFSDFAGYARTMVLLRGGGVALKLSDGTQRIMRAAGDLAQFDGALGVECALLNGPCVDLNLMTSKAMGLREVRVERVRGSRSYVVRKDESLVVFPLDAPLQIHPSGGHAPSGSHEPSGHEAILEPWDLAVLGGSAESAGRIVCHEDACAVFLAALIEPRQGFNLPRV
jgi:environmental stress-induced protein Ves